jgi:DNA-damage-inducible protein J
MGYNQIMGKARVHRKAASHHKATAAHKTPGKDTRDAMIRARTTSRIKSAAERIFEKLGLTPSEAINLFYTQVSLRKGLPFSVEIPNAETLETFAKTDRNEEVVDADNADDLFKKLGI